LIGLGGALYTIGIGSTSGIACRSERNLARVRLAAASVHYAAVVCGPAGREARCFLPGPESVMWLGC
jgi:hypothetical protein